MGIFTAHSFLGAAMSLATGTLPGLTFYYVFIIGQAALRQQST
jgi:hypothetical protein